MRDPDMLRHIIHYFVFVAAAFATAFPALYLFSPWYKSRLGRLLMLQALSYAVALDITCVFQYWHPTNIIIRLWVGLFIFGFLALASASFTWMLWQTNWARWYTNRETGERWSNKSAPKRRHDD